jgi:DNA-binding MarR family transcriptional regulator
MLVLWEGDQVNVSDIGRRLHLDSGTLTPLLKRLQAIGLLERTRSLDDERQVTVSLTASGRRMRDRAARVPKLLAHASGCSAGELASLRKQLAALRDRFADLPPSATSQEGTTR